MNVVILSGNLGRDPELSYTPQTQTACCRLSVAVARQKKDEQPDWVRVTVWGRQAETTNQYCSKGSKIAVQGRITTGSYKDRQGNTVYTTEVTAERVEFLDSRNNHVAQPMQDTVNNIAGTGFNEQEYLPWEQ